MPAKKTIPAKKARPVVARAAPPAKPATPQPARPQPEGAAPVTPVRPPFRRPQTAVNFAGVGRNDICPCGSGKRFKNCHGH